MSNRFDFKKTEPAAYKAMLQFENYMESTSLLPLEKELIRIRASQLNGCAYCVNMHARDARKLGEAEHRIYSLSVWKESPFYSEKERAILALTEEVTLITAGVSEKTYRNALAVLGEKKVAEVIMATIIINGWNRIGVSMQMVPEALETASVE